MGILIFFLSWTIVIPIMWIIGIFKAKSAANAVIIHLMNSLNN
ncbi:hypothetical protein CIB43_00714 [Mesomycoplasma hyopneumoniae]|uniref:Uncharacterized protein n=2 Tax=Mesomycoplasma TaxID=2923352 RepID=A0A223MAM2_MESHO|nr:hypothetical protein CIB43_00714 [Mesomycoplasma hyopneumoniae]